MKKYALISSLLLLSLILVGCNKLKQPNGSPTSGENAVGTEQPVGKHAADDEETFIVNMIPHHQEAIDNSQIIIANSTNPDVKELAQNIIAAQTTEIIQMKDWLTSRYPNDALQSLYEHMMPDLTNLNGSELDRAYLLGMIAHHQGAIQMANDVLMLSERRPEVEQLANNIKTTQTAEIAQMEALLQNIE